MSAVTMNSITAGIESAVRQLKVERDTWQAVALQYKAAFETQTNRLQELQNVCYATQAELENERATLPKSYETSDRSSFHRNHALDGAEDLPSFGTATFFSATDCDRRRHPSDDCTNPLFTRVQQCVDKRNYGSALVEIERLLRGPLSPKARTEGLLLKSSILRAAGPDELYHALAVCSEAQELCDRLMDLKSFLPKVQYQRGVLYYQLRMLRQARDAFSAISDDHQLYAAASEYRRSCDDELELQRTASRRSGFDTDRTFTEGILVGLDDRAENKRRRMSAQFRFRAATKAKRLSLPHRWVSSKSDMI